jgi:hypothetical protein
MPIHVFHTGSELFLNKHISYPDHQIYITGMFIFSNDMEWRLPTIILMMNGNLNCKEFFPPNINNIMQCFICIVGVMSLLNLMLSDENTCTYTK